MVQLAQTTMRSELGKITLDKTFAGREHLNADIVRSINVASEAWGVTCLRYEIRDINPPPGVKHVRPQNDDRANPQSTPTHRPHTFTYHLSFAHPIGRMLRVCSLACS